MIGVPQRGLTHRVFLHLHPRRREDSGGRESAKISPYNRGGWLSCAEPFWFRLRRLRVQGLRPWTNFTQGPAVTGPNELACTALEHACLDHSIYRHQVSSWAIWVCEKRGAAFVGHFRRISCSRTRSSGCASYRHRAPLSRFTQGLTQIKDTQACSTQIFFKPRQIWACSHRMRPDGTAQRS
jgi:hypothetical protein